MKTKGTVNENSDITSQSSFIFIRSNGPKSKDITQFMNNYNLLNASIDQKNVGLETNNIFNDITKDASQKRRWNLNSYLGYKENMVNNLLDKLYSNKDNRNSIGSEEKVKEGIRWYEDKIITSLNQKKITLLKLN